MIEPTHWPVTHISVSQIETFSACPRKWWIQYVDKWPRSGGRHFSIGTALHGCIERHFLGKKPFEAGWALDLDPYERIDVKDMFKAGLAEGLIPENPPDVNFLVEHNFTFSFPNGSLPFLVGFVDLCFPEHNLVVDWKTTSSWKYAKTKRELETNTQVLIYARALQSIRRDIGLPESEGFSVAHGVFLKKTPYNYRDIENGESRTKYISVDVSWANVEKKWVECSKKAEEMMEVASEAEEWYDIPDPANKPDPCNMYGGCEYKAVCFHQLNKAQWLEQHNNQ